MDMRTRIIDGDIYQVRTGGPIDAFGLSTTELFSQATGLLPVGGKEVGVAKMLVNQEGSEVHVLITGDGKNAYALLKLVS